MTSVNVHQAKTHLSRLLERVEKGEQIVISRAGRPVARLAPIQAPPRRPGRLKGKLHVAADFDAPLPVDLVTYDLEIAPYVSATSGCRTNTSRRCSARPRPEHGLNTATSGRPCARLARAHRACYAAASRRGADRDCEAWGS
jgi:prevent-host-death family protein